MTRDRLIEEIFKKKSYLCTGLDTEIERLPQSISKNIEGMKVFNQKIIAATKSQSIAYKINTAFYEQYGAQGWEAMEATLAMLPNDCFKIADAKRGDIGNTGKMYAKAFFETLNFDAITVSPYMGEDSLRPFLEYQHKFTICLALTSNAGYKDFQLLEDAYSHKKLFESVINTVCKYGTESNLMFVCGATHSIDLQAIRELIPSHFLLIPGVGAQGGNLAEISKITLTDSCGILVNSSRGIIYASAGDDFEIAAQQAADELQKEMEALMIEKGIVE